MGHTKDKKSKPSEGQTGRFHETSILSLNFLGESGTSSSKLRRHQPAANSLFCNILPLSPCGSIFCPHPRFLPTRNPMKPNILEMGREKNWRVSGGKAAWLVDSPFSPGPSLGALLDQRMKTRSPTDADPDLRTHPTALRQSLFRRSPPVFASR
jgi:hypothetical protein